MFKPNLTKKKKIMFDKLQTAVCKGSNGNICADGQMLIHLKGWPVTAGDGEIL